MCNVFSATDQSDSCIDNNPRNVGQVAPQDHAGLAVGATGGVRRELNWEGALTLKKVRLELGRTRDFPEGSPDQCCESIVALTPSAQINRKIWEAEKLNRSPLRFWGNADFERGELIPLPEGGWAFSYAPGEEDDEPIYRLADRTLSEGEYVSITEHDGVTRPFKVVRTSEWRPEGPERPGPALGCKRREAKGEGR